MQLTKGEEQIMLVLWQLEFGTVKDILSKLTSPKPAYNTVSTIVRILENKKFIKHKSFGKGYLYYPAIKKEVYSSKQLQKLIDDYFEGSFEKLLSFYTTNNKLKLSELNTLFKEVKRLCL